MMPGEIVFHVNRTLRFFKSQILWFFEGAEDYLSMQNTSMYLKNLHTHHNTVKIKILNYKLKIGGWVCNSTVGKK